MRSNTEDKFKITLLKVLTKSVHEVLVQHVYTNTFIIVSLFFLSLIQRRHHVLKYRGGDNALPGDKEMQQTRKQIKRLYAYTKKLYQLNSNFKKCKNYKLIGQFVL